MNSILPQLESGDELVLCDDASTDNSLAICQKFAALYPGSVRVIANGKNEGLLMSRRYLYASAGRNYILNVDADDELEASALAELRKDNYLLKKRIVRVLAQHEPYQAIHCKSMFYCAATVEAGKRLGIPVRVAQCHVDKPKRLSLFYRWYYHWCARRIEKSATDKLAVSKGAVE